MKSGKVQRGRGPWPLSNEALVVRQWLMTRIVGLELREQQSVIRLLLDEVSGVSRSERLLGNWMASESELERLALACDRLNQGEPLQYILGSAHFMGLDIGVNDSVLIPRPETEELVHRMLQRVPSSKSLPRKVLDIGTGSGVISLAWKSNRPLDMVHGLDISTEALKTARSNAERLGLVVHWHEKNIVSGETVADQVLNACDVILSNPPYIAESEKSEMNRQVTDWEPDTALFVPDHDPLIFYRCIIAGCESNGWLTSAGWLGFECHRDGVQEICELFDPDHWKSVEKEQDMQGNWRMIFAQRRALDSKS